MKVLDIFVSTENELTIICFMNETLIYLLDVLHELIILLFGSAFNERLEDEHKNLVPFQFVKCIGQNIFPITSFGNKLPTANTISTVGKSKGPYILEP